MNRPNWAAAVATVQSIVAGLDSDEISYRATVDGLRGPLGQTITATVSGQPPLSSHHISALLEVAEMNRGDNDAGLGLVIAPAGLPGIDTNDAAAWNVHMTLPTLLELLGQSTK